MGTYNNVHVSFVCAYGEEATVKQCATELLGKFDVKWRVVDGVRDIDFEHFSRTETDDRPHYAIICMLDEIAKGSWEDKIFSWASSGKSLDLDMFLAETQRFFQALLEHHLTYAIWVMWQGEQTETAVGVHLVWRKGYVMQTRVDLPDLIGFETAITAGEYE